VRALGADTVASLRLTLTEVTGSLAKHHAQCVIGVSGDMLKRVPS